MGVHTHSPHSIPSAILSNLPFRGALCARRALTLLDGGGEAQLASFDLLYGHLQPRGQQLRYLQIQHELLCIAAKKEDCNAKRWTAEREVSRRTHRTPIRGVGGSDRSWGAGQLGAQRSPPLPAEQADLVGHHALLELVLGRHRAAHLAGAALQGSDFHHVVDKGQREAEAAQDVRVLLLSKGRQGGG